MTLRRPLTDVAGVLDSLHALQPDEFLGQLRTEARLHYFVCRKGIQSFVQRLRQEVNFPIADLLVSLFVQVHVERLARIQLAINPVNARRR